MSTLAERLKKHREAIGKSQGQLAKLVGVSRTSISHWESGETEPRGKNLIRLAAVLGVDSSELQTGKQQVKDQIVVAKADEQYIIHQVPLLAADKIEEWLGCPILKVSHTRVNMPLDTKAGNSTFAYKVLGSSMVHPHDHGQSLVNGDIVMVDPSELKKLKPGHIVLAKFGENDMRVRQYQEDGKNIFLKAFDSSIPPAPLKKGITLLGKVICIYRNTNFD